MIAISLGCPASVGPEVTLRALEAWSRAKPAGSQAPPAEPPVLCGSRLAILQAAELLRIPRSRFYEHGSLASGKARWPVLDAGPALKERDLNPQAPSQRAGQSQLAAVEAAFGLVKSQPGGALVTGPVSKHVIASCGTPGARRFKGHTEWLERLDGAKSSVMCFYSPHLTTSLVTTHVPISQVARRVSREGVSESITLLGRFLIRLGVAPLPRLAVCSLNPHAGESELLGTEERTAIVPGIRAARRRLRKSCDVIGPVGAETAYRLAHAGRFDGVVAMYHDQATIPMKLVAFGDAVNVTLGLSRIRTSVDHGTAYDIAWRGTADAAGMLAALRLARRLQG